MTEAIRQACIEMKDSKFLKEDGEDGKDDGEAEEEGMDLFKKKTHKNSKFAASHSKGFGGGASSFARKRKKIR